MKERDVLFEATSVTAGYAGITLFDGVDIRLHAGELVCFMGPNGCGKSTLIRTLAGLQPALSGTIPKRDETKVAVVLTERVHSQHMRVRELVGYGRYPYLGWTLGLTEEDQKIIDECLASVHIGHLAETKLDELSDGQMQMVMITRALVQQTPVLLLDEPTAHLDLNNRLEIMNLLRRLARENNKAILLVTHELDLALQTADRVWLADGKKIRTGIPEDLVLDGSFDSVFQFKGYDLRTGRVEHESFRNKTVQLIGEGSVFLWTRNALERSGFNVENTGQVVIEMLPNGWRVGTTEFRSIADLLSYLDQRNWG